MKPLPVKKFINNRFELIHPISGGSEGSVYIARDHHTGKELAIKLYHEPSGHKSYHREVSGYRYLAGLMGVPKFYWAGQDQRYHATAIELLGPSLAHLWRDCGRRFSLKTVLLLADQLICRLQELHSRNCVHRDIKPENLLIGVGRKANRVYVADLGFVKRYSALSDRQILKRERHDRRECEKNPGIGVGLQGTEVYAAWRAHYAKPQSPRDDMESLGYVLVRFLKGHLPWERLWASAGTDLERQIAVAEMKRNIRTETLCKGLPSAFNLYFLHICLKATPDYTYLREIFLRLFRREGFKDDQTYDWTFKQEAELLRQHCNNRLKEQVKKFL